MRKHIGLTLAEIYDLELRQWQAFKRAAERQEKQDFARAIQIVALGTPGDEEKAREVAKIVKELMS